MLYSRGTLENNVQKILNTAEEKQREQIIHSLIDKNMDRLEATKYVEGSKDIVLLSDMELYWLCEAVNSAGAELKFEHYFSKNEIQLYSNSAMEKSEKVVFKNIIKIDKDRYVTTLTSKKIKEMFDEHILVYNTETQRQLVIKEKGKNVIYKIDINKTSVKEITSLLDRELYIPDTIVLNANTDGKTVLEIDEENREIILKKGVLDIGDGMHRILAIRNSHNQDIIFPVEICMFNTEKMNIYISQKNKQNKFKKDYVRAIDPLNDVTDIVNTINQESKILKGLITQNSQIDKVFLVKIISLNFKIKSKKEKIKLEEYLLENLDKIFKKNIELLEDENGEEKTVDKEVLCLIIAGLAYYYQQKEVNISKITETVNDEEIRKGINISYLTQSNKRFKELEEYFK